MRNKLIVLVTLFAFTITGCTQQSVDVPKQNNASIIQLEAYVLSKKEQPAPDVKVDRKDCKECKGTGKIKSGDGILTEACPFCEVKTSELPLDISVLPNYNCCEDCICENCSCTYPGQCLIARNNGWPVQVCDGGQCRVYWPQDDNGVKYNPYDLLPQNKKAQLKQHQQPTKIDKRGNPL